MRIVTALMIAAATAVSHEAPQQKSAASIPEPVRKVMAQIRPETVRAHTRFLSSDLLEGRAPGTRGGELAASYIAAQFEAMGLAPAGDDGTYLQRVPLLGISSDAARTAMTFTRGKENVELKFLRDFVATDESQQGEQQIDGELLFVGHGVVAPEFRWDDFKDVDVSGKVLVVLVDDPPATAAEPELFGGRARTYYGRWSYKFETAAQRGAVGAILVHTDASAGYGWNVVRNSWGRERPYVKLHEGERGLRMASWVTEAAGRSLFALAGSDLDKAIALAGSRDFKPVPLGVRVRASIGSNVREVNTANVVAKLEGSDPKLRDEAVLYTAHYDHLGMTENPTGDGIYNGALDNATGVAVVLEIARAWTLADPKPPRSIIFAAVAAEEGGLRGSEFYAENPVVPPGKTVVGLNFDSVRQFGETNNVSMLGVERTTFEPVARRVTAAMGLRIDPDLHPEQGSYFRSDHFSLAKKGIPAFSVTLGNDYRGKPKEWGEAKAKEYGRNRYHQPDDEFDESWDFAGGVQAAQLGFFLGWEAAQLRTLPTWVAGHEFRATRDESFVMAGRD